MPISDPEARRAYERQRYLNRKAGITSAPHQVSLDSDLKRYLSKVDERGPDQCWPWLGGCFDFGHGAFWVGTKRMTKQAHHFGYEHLVGPIPPPPNNFVRHTCDNPPCQNPAHWVLGSNFDNIADRHERGRDARGERQWKARLTTEDVLRIRDLAATTGITQLALAEEYDVSPSTISCIIRRETWAHI